jgi:hypothetical protein
MAKFPDLNKDGKVTQADVLMGRGVKLANGGRIVYKTDGGSFGQDETSPIDKEHSKRTEETNKKRRTEQEERTKLLLETKQYDD